ncbi:LAFE_0C07558g1_1 [Lachancea fermentati]|uniref:LAFE_0C07558g1_1 n=1 Tax=Lachancea fermentati TaxID=4955 RepID=A0A1G4M9T5_LACFM|nr:LAFE_0C07558g1_1 [Lachancea fermentati]
MSQENQDTEREAASATASTAPVLPWDLTQQSIPVKSFTGYEVQLSGWVRHDKLKVHHDQDSAVPDDSPPAQVASSVRLPPVHADTDAEPDADADGGVDVDDDDVADDDDADDHLDHVPSSST